MDERIETIFQIPNIDEYGDIHLQTLAENCAALEDRIYSFAKALPEEQRMIIEAYISTRNDLEVETFKTALRWGKRHYK